MLRALALSEQAGSVTRRLLALVTIYDGGARVDAARLGGVGLQTLRDWVLRFNAKGPDGLVDGKSSGRPSLRDDERRRALVAMVEAGPNPAIHEVVRWRSIDLAHQSVPASRPRGQSRHGRAWARFALVLSAHH